MNEDILILNREELIQRLMNGEKLQPSGLEEAYCIYDKTQLGSPFRYVSNGCNKSMDAIWGNISWRLYKESNNFWIPKHREQAFYIESNGKVSSSIDWDSRVDDQVIEMGNVFKTHEDAKKYIKFKKAETRLREAIWKLNEGSAPVFKRDLKNYSVHINEDTIDINVWYYTQVNPDWLWFKTVALAEQLISSHEADLLIYLHGV